MRRQDNMRVRCSTNRALCNGTECLYRGEVALDSAYRGLSDNLE
jgi:hypothetical protein